MRENADQINSKYRRFLRSVQDVLQASIILQTGSRMSEIQAASVQSGIEEEWRMNNPVKSF